jgi:membrane-bound inhibitor of C-type lysozyme
MRLRVAVAALSIAALTSACTPDAEAPPDAAAPSAGSAAPAGPTAQAVSYACESGQSVSVAYPDTSTAQVTYRGETHVLRSVEAASGARYAGSGLEWWTATRDGVESATLGRLGAPNEQGGATMLERCSRPSAGPTAPGPVTPAPTVSGAQPVSAPCRGAQLRLSTAGGDAGAGRRVSVIGVQNTGARACSLTGYPSVAVLDAQGRPMTAIRTEQHAAAGNTARSIELAPNGRAYFDVSWTVIPHEDKGETACPAAARIRVTPPGDTASATLAQAFTPCGGRVEVGPFRAVAEPRPS